MIHFRNIPNIAIFGVLACLFSRAEASVSVTVSTSAPASLQDQFIADATAQYVGILAKSPTSNVWTFKISARKDNPPPIVYVYPDTFLDGYIFGIEDERARDLKTIDDYVNLCSTGTSCAGDLRGPWFDIYQQNYSTPIAPNGGH